MTDFEWRIDTNDNLGALPKKSREASYDSDEEPCFNEPDKRLHWNIDPEYSFSDWKIKISVLEDGSEIDSRVYHVHKSVLAVGSRRSEYFASTFYNDNCEALNDGTSIIRLEKSAADVFHILLDYLYFPERPLKVSRKNLVPMHYLGSYLEMQQLVTDTKRLLKKDLNIGNCASYYEQALLVNDAKVQKLVAKTCAAKIEEIFPNSEIIKASKSSLWLQALQHYPKRDYTKCCHMSRLMVSFCENSSELDAAILCEIVNKVNLPHIPLDAAMSFITIENRLSRDRDLEELSDTQKRLIECFASRWSTSGMVDASFSSFLKEQSSLFLSELMMRVVEEAQRTKSDLEREKSSMLDNMSKCSLCSENATEYYR